ncbi:hypothetical protein DEA8626_01917 [Defluviimonas aquaemixtae]|uniref:TfoX N-terminal domain-containing protein n=1 Tax=Albidovulum aquaemixtae TaxID=1542388 RepID=A0A2R8B6Y7_9RHOB|nr:TfoX/Sxy family protein [Defluviimonas aquaemixtae]SPH18379.1 hypothetical protein DEA8626_01917 [Defluviimonas aquaemixtae]
MAIDQGLLQIMRDDLAGETVTEKKMFGGVALLLRGNMLCGVHQGGGVFRVGKDNEAAALDMPGVVPMAFTGRRMGGWVEVTDEVVTDDARRAWLMALALPFVKSLPPK